jgi:aspartate-semialdehyde dehydrogenase
MIQDLAPSSMKSSIRLAIVGATGAVGKELLSVLEKRKFPLASLRCFASPRSSGKHVTFRGETLPIETLNEDSFEDVDIAIMSAGRNIAFEYAPIAVRSGAIVIDNSSAFRREEKVPLVIPEINAHALKKHEGIIASPNCSTTIMLMALAPLHRQFGIRRVVAATYQAASGAGAAAMEELKAETRAVLDGIPFTRKILPFPYAFNLFTHNSPLAPDGYVDEELKMLHETRKILEDESIGVSATCVRVPVLRAHSEALNVTFRLPVTAAMATEILKRAPGLTWLENQACNRFPMPSDASGQDAVFWGRVREDFSFPHTLNLWVVGDQLLKGAALNAVQIAEQLIHQDYLCRPSLQSSPS